MPELWFKQITNCLQNLINLPRKRFLLDISRKTQQAANLVLSQATMELSGSSLL